MRQLWDFLLANPILFFVLAAWAAGAIGNALRTKTGQRKATEQRAGRQSQPGSAPRPSPQRDKRVAADRPEPIRRESLDRPEPIRRESLDRPEPIRRQSVEPPPIRQQAQAGSGSDSPDEIAAEMRRILGLDVDIQPAVRERSEPVRREPRRVPVRPERPSTAVMPTTQLQHLDLHERSRVGEQAAARKQPRSGHVGEHDASWGSLGGRHTERVAPIRATTAQRLLDMSDLKRMILAAEILGPPVCLRGENEMRTL